ncbi:Mini-ribonuclease 3 [Clostridium thermarum]|uniref:Mini-ribonuclease 3 n=1 Tax=Clostridium thermarum TaxID=1716543 RepID=UPI0011221EEC|nr:ribonuclease III domain-containing protein [Clostridium thermarum]
MIFSYTGRKFTIDEARRMNSLALAYIGDAVFEVMVREHLLINNTNLSAHKLHVKAISYVKASSQCAFVRKLEEHFTEEEMQVFKKGRNAKSPTMPKNTSVSDYRTATGFEALLGYLYITAQIDRLELFMNIIFNDKKVTKE